MPIAPSVGLKAKLRFEYSPFCELVFSLNVLSEPGRHGTLLPWVIRFKEKVSPDLQAGLDGFRERLGGWTQAAAFALRRIPLRDHAVETALEKLPRLAADAPHDWPGLDAGGVRALAERLREYWTTCFYEEFYWIEPLLVRSIKEQATALERREALGFLQDLYPAADIWFSLAEGVLVVERAAGEVRRRLDELEALVLIPSVFATGPVVAEREGALLLSYPVAPAVVQPKSDLVPPETLSRQLKTLADETRLKIVKLLAERPWCTQDLAAELELSEPTVSRHLKLLREAGLITNDKQGNFIYYSLRFERLAEMHMKLLDYLRA